MTRSISATLLFLLFLPLLFSCGSDESGSEGDDSALGNARPAAPASYVVDSAYYDTLSKNPTPLANGRSSVDALVTAALEGIRRNDTATLKSLLITQDEYLKIIYPEFGKHWPGARDMRPEIREALWANHIGNSMKGLRRGLRDFGGEELGLEKVEFTDGTKEYVSYRIREGTVVTVKDTKGKKHKLSVIGSIVEKDGVFKLLSYRDQDAE